MAKQKNASHTQINLSQYLKAFTEIKHYIFITYPAFVEKIRTIFAEIHTIYGLFL